MPYRLGVDLGTTFTAAAVAGGSSEPTVVGLGNRATGWPGSSSGGSATFDQPAALGRLPDFCDPFSRGTRIDGRRGHRAGLNPR